MRASDGPAGGRLFGCWQAGLLLCAAAAGGCGGPTATREPNHPDHRPTATEAAAAQQPGAAEADGDGAPSPPPETSSHEGATPEAAPGAPATGAMAQTACTDSPGQEDPVHNGNMGDGDRVIRVRNLTGVPVRLRLLDAGEQPALRGTLHIAEGGTGEIHVPAGRYQIRYRLEPSCEVLRGSPIPLIGNRSGVEIALRASRASSSSGSVQHVREDL